MEGNDLSSGLVRQCVLIARDANAPVVSGTHFVPEPVAHDDDQAKRGTTTDGNKAATIDVRSVWEVNGPIALNIQPGSDKAANRLLIGSGKRVHGVFRRPSDQLDEAWPRARPRGVPGRGQIPPSRRL